MLEKHEGKIIQISKIENSRQKVQNNAVIASYWNVLQPYTVYMYMYILIGTKTFLVKNTIFLKARWLMNVRSPDQQILFATSAIHVCSCTCTHLMFTCLQCNTCLHFEITAMCVYGNLMNRKQHWFMSHDIKSYSNSTVITSFEIINSVVPVQFPPLLRQW